VPAHQPSESIEGAKIEGHSRDPLRPQCTKLVNGIRCFIYHADFNVYAEIITVRPPDAPKLDGGALTAQGETLGSDTAILTIVAKTRTPRHKDVFQALASHVTSTHGANKWAPKEQTNVKVKTPRQDIINAIQKRQNVTLATPKRLVSNL
jgi:hypothetical protein